MDLAQVVVTAAWAFGALYGVFRAIEIARDTQDDLAALRPLPQFPVRRQLVLRDLGGVLFLLGSCVCASLLVIVALLFPPELKITAGRLLVVGVILGVVGCLEYQVRAKRKAFALLRAQLEGSNGNRSDPK